MVYLLRLFRCRLVGHKRNRGGTPYRHGKAHSACRRCGAAMVRERGSWRLRAAADGATASMPADWGN